MELNTSIIPMFLLIFVFCFKIRWLNVLFLLIVCKPSSQAYGLKFKPNETDYSPDCFENGIKVICFENFLQSAASTLNDTSSANFLTALWRKINSEADIAAKSRHKRQTIVPIRREVRAMPYETNFFRFAQAVRRLKNHFVSSQYHSIHHTL